MNKAQREAKGQIVIREIYRTNKNKKCLNHKKIKYYLWLLKKNLLQITKIIDRNNDYLLFVN